MDKASQTEMLLESATAAAENSQTPAPAATKADLQQHSHQSQSEEQTILPPCAGAAEIICGDASPAHNQAAQAQTDSSPQQMPPLAAPTDKHSLPSAPCIVSLQAGNECLPGKDVSISRQTDLQHACHTPQPEASLTVVSAPLLLGALTPAMPAVGVKPNAQLDTPPTAIQCTFAQPDLAQHVSASKTAHGLHNAAKHSASTCQTTDPAKPATDCSGPALDDLSELELEGDDATAAQVYGSQSCAVSVAPELADKSAAHNLSGAADSAGQLAMTVLAQTTHVISDSLPFVSQIFNRPQLKTDSNGAAQVQSSASCIQQEHCPAANSMSAAAAKPIIVTGLSASQSVTATAVAAMPCASLAQANLLATAVLRSRDTSKVAAERSVTLFSSSSRVMLQQGTAGSEGAGPVQPDTIIVSQGQAPPAKRYKPDVQELPVTTAKQPSLPMQSLSQPMLTDISSDDASSPARSNVAKYITDCAQDKPAQNQPEPTAVKDVLPAETANSQSTWQQQVPKPETFKELSASKPSSQVQAPDGISAIFSSFSGLEDLSDEEDGQQGMLSQVASQSGERCFLQKLLYADLTKHTN